MTAKMVVTPWEVSGDIDYVKLIKEFGTQSLTDALIKRIEKEAGESHFMLRRKVFFSHRELDTLLKEHDEGKPWALYTGRGPSGKTHLGHMLPWFFTKYLQDAFKVNLYFQITDDEKFLCKPGLSIKQTNKFAYDNALDLIALGFDPKNTFIIVDTDYAKTLYKIAIQVAKKVTTSSAKAVFGFTNETNIGMMFWPAIQAAPCFLPSILEGRPVRTLIPAAIDQDPYWRIVRDVAPKLGYPKTAAIHNIFLPALTGPGKMSTSVGEHTTIFTTDTPEQVEHKIIKYAFSGGRGSMKEHREKGGVPEVDVSYQWLRIMFEPYDKKLKKIYDDYKSGSMLTGELKHILVKKINIFLKKHQKEREKAKKNLDKFILKD
jgi:tryptophanyl-tRNA synthetase